MAKQLQSPCCIGSHGGLNCAECDSVTICEYMINRFHLVGPSSDGQQCLLEEMKTRRDALLVSHGAGARPSSNLSAILPDHLSPCLYPGNGKHLNGRECRPPHHKRGVHSMPK